MHTGHATTGTKAWPFLQVGGVDTATSRRIERGEGLAGEKVELKSAASAGSCEEHLAALADPLDLSTTQPDDLILNEAGVVAFERLEDRIRAQAKLLERYAFASRGGNQPGVAAAFVGGEGLGKTLAARVLAKRLERPLYRVSFDAVVGDTAARTLKNLAEAIDLAAAAGAILLFDDIDALMITSSRNGVDRDAKIIQAGLAQKLRSQCGVVILTSTHGNSLDAGILDALTEKTSFVFPAEAERSKIWERAFPSEVPTEQLPLSSIARHNLSGSQICKAALKAASKACAAERTMSIDDIKDAVREIIAMAGCSYNERDFNY